MKWRIMGQLYSAQINATKVANELSAYPLLLNRIEDAVDEGGNPYVLLDVVLEEDVNKAAAKQKLRDAIITWSITGKLTFHACRHTEYGEVRNQPCINVEVEL